MVHQVGLDISKSQADQDPEKWEQFVQKVLQSPDSILTSGMRSAHFMVDWQVVESFPRLKFYEGHWPVPIYYDFYAYRARRTHTGLTQSKSTKNMSRASHTPPRTTRNHPYVKPPPVRLSPERQIMGDIMNKRTLPSQSKRAHMAPPILLLPPRTTRPSPIGQTKSVSTLNSGPPHEQAASTVSYSQECSSCSISKSNHQPSVKRVWPEACPVCGTPPVVKPADNANLKDLLAKNDAEELLEVLAKMGIFHDHHLTLIRGLPSSDRESFLESFGAETLTDFQRPILIEMLGERSVAQPGRNKLPQPKPANMNQADAAGGGGRMTCNCYCEIPPLQENIPTELQKHLRGLGLDDLLLPAIMFGLRTNKDFDKICKYGGERLEKYIRPGLKGVKLTPFQAMLLQFAIRNTWA